MLKVGRQNTFPIFFQTQKDSYPSPIIIKENLAEWDVNIIKWLKENGYKRVGQLRGDIFLANS